MIGNVQSILLDNLVTNEGPTTIVTDQLSLQVEKVSVIEFGSKPNVLKNSRFQPPSASALGLRDGKSDNYPDHLVANYIQVVFLVLGKTTGSCNCRFYGLDAKY